MDKPQNRDKRQTAVDQAFEYAPKMGGECQWVIVSNIEEVRFYCANDRSRCQRFFLKELKGENKLKELLFLFHRDHFLAAKTEKSHTDRFLEQLNFYPQIFNQELHIVDKMYKCLKRFEGFGFVDPNYIASLYPFNILDQYVWHYSDDNYMLFTNNRAIYDFLQEITVEDSVIIVSDKLTQELQNNSVIDSRYKIEWLFQFLNNCLIYNIKAIKDYEYVTRERKGVIISGPEYIYMVEDERQQVFRNISLSTITECDCLRCNYNNLELNKFLSKLKSDIGAHEKYTLDLAFANYRAGADRKSVV